MIHDIVKPHAFTVYNLKTKIFALLNVPVARQKLLYKGTLLKDDTLYLTQTKLQDGSQVGSLHINIYIYIYIYNIL